MGIPWSDPVTAGDDAAKHGSDNNELGVYIESAPSDQRSKPFLPYRFSMRSEFPYFLAELTLLQPEIARWSF